MKLNKTALVIFGLAAAGLCGLTRISFTQSSQHDRIAGRISGSPAVWMEGNRRLMFQAENDLGPADDGLRLENMSLRFKPSAEQQANLDTLLAEQQNPSSPNYHHWLTPEQFADNFGLSANDIAQVVAWLQSQGFTVTQTARSRLWVSFSGTAGQVRSAFQTEIHNYSLNGRTYYANASEPAVPAVLADLVQCISALDDYAPKPHSVFRQIDVSADPHFTSYLSGKNFVAPADFAIIYDVNALYNAGYSGSGQTIAILGQTDLYDSGSDITAFRAAAGLPAKGPNIILVPGASDPGVVSGDLDEASLDVEWSGAVAPNATIDFINGGSGGVFNDALPYAIEHTSASVISTSYGLCEQEWAPSDRASFETMVSEATALGQTFIAAAGDSGAADCDNNTSSTTVVTTATHGYAVDFPASSPYVTALGGSEFNEGSETYWKTAPNGADVSPSALSYIPEMVWNDTSSTLGLEAGGGGASVDYSRPTWQTGAGNFSNDGMRDVPDVSLNASGNHDGYLVCIQDTCVNGFRNTDQTLNVAGGTSAAAPSFAGIVALINQYTNSDQGAINSKLYALAASSPSAFHDITTGNNIVPCRSGSTECPSSGEIGFSAVAGYDEASGLGSVDAYNLATAWNSSSSGNLAAPTLTAPANGATGVSLTPIFSWTAVSGNAGYVIMVAVSPGDLPTNPATSTCAACALVATVSTNTTTYTVPSTSPLPEGTYYWQVQAVDPTSGGVAAWSSVFSFTTTGGTLTAPTLASPVNGATSVTVQPTFSWTSVTGNNGYRIAIASAEASLPTSPTAGSCSTCSVSATTTTTTFTPASTALAGGTTYYWEVQALAPSGGGQNGPWSTVFSFSTGAADFSLSASPGSLPIAPVSSGASTVTLTPINNFSATPTFTCSVSSTLTGVTCLVGTYSNSAVTVTVTASSTAKYLPITRQKPPLRLLGELCTAIVCLLLMAVIRLRNRGATAPRLGSQFVATSALFTLLLMSAISCGGSGGGGGTSNGPTSTAESGTVTVTGASTTTHTVTISVSVS